MSEHQPVGMHQHSMSNAPDAILREGDDEGYAAQHAPVLADGVLYLPAHGLAFGTTSRDNAPADQSGPLFGMLYLRLGPSGLCVKLTSVMARDLGGTLLRAAGEMEAHAKAQADATLARAAQGPAQ